MQESKLIALNHAVDKLIIFVKNGQVPKYLQKKKKRKTYHKIVLFIAYKSTYIVNKTHFL